MAGDMFCKGNGLSLGLTDGTNNFTFSGVQQDEFRSNVAQYGTSIGNIGSSSNPNYTQWTAVGVTTDAEKSGIIVDIDSLIILCSMIIKY